MSLSNDSFEKNVAPENTLKVLVATDTHLGYAEKDAIRGADSFVTFEEILQLAVKNEVDFILLGGDLFHDSKPSPFCIYKCLELLKRYCLGDKPVCLEFLSDMSYNFPTLKNPIVNYEDPNLNVSIPVFSIHGNHDDPIGQKQISALDIVASTGLINYFGRWSDLSHVEIRPILLQKGETKLALYGLSHIKDERLGRLFREHKVVMKKVADTDWFNMLVLHQNRAARGVKNFIPDSFIDEFMNLVIWGHEHDCRIEPERLENGVYISQPGSSVATSLAIGEAIPKKVGLLKICGDRFQMIPIALKTVRPFKIDELILENPSSDNYNLEKPSEQAMSQVKDKIDNMIRTVMNDYEGSEDTLPLIRLKVFYHHENQQFNAIRVGMQFTDRVANPDSIIKLNSMNSNEKKKKSNFELDEDHFERFVNIHEWATNVEDVVMKLFEDEKYSNAMTVLTAKGLTDAVTRSVKYNDTEAIGAIIDREFQQTFKDFLKMDPDIECIDDAIQTLKTERRSNKNDEVVANNVELDIPNISSSEVKVENMVVDRVDTLIISSDDENFSIGSTSTKSKKKANVVPRGRGGRGSRARGARGKRGKNESYEALL